MIHSELAVEFVINGKSSEDQATLEEALLAEDWLERTQSQLTYAGLVALSECLLNDAPCVLFRNNHFSTILKHDNLIYQLVTDEGYAAEKSCVWEQLSNIEGMISTIYFPPYSSILQLFNIQILFLIFYFSN